MNALTLFITGFFGWCGTGKGGVFHLRPVTPLSLKLDDLNFCTELLWGRINILGKKSRDQIDNDVTMTSSLL